VQRFCGQGRWGCSSDADVRTFWCKKLGIFEIYDVSERTRGGRGVNFLRFCAGVFYGRPLTIGDRLAWNNERYKFEHFCLVRSSSTVHIHVTCPKVTEEHLRECRTHPIEKSTLAEGLSHIISAKILINQTFQFVISKHLQPKEEFPVIVS